MSSDFCFHCIRTAWRTSVSLRRARKKSGDDAPERNMKKHWLFRPHEAVSQGSLTESCTCRLRHCRGSGPDLGPPMDWNPFSGLEPPPDQTPHSQAPPPPSCPTTSESTWLWKKSQQGRHDDRVWVVERGGGGGTGEHARTICAVSLYLLNFQVSLVLLNQWQRRDKAWSTDFKKKKKKKKKMPACFCFRNWGAPSCYKTPDLSSELRQRKHRTNVLHQKCAHREDWRTHSAGNNARVRFCEQMEVTLSLS